MSSTSSHFSPEACTHQLEKAILDRHVQQLMMLLDTPSIPAKQESQSESQLPCIQNQNRKDGSLDEIPTDNAIDKSKAFQIAKGSAPVSRTALPSPVSSPRNSPPRPTPTTTDEAPAKGKRSRTIRKARRSRQDKAMMLHLRKIRNRESANRSRLKKEKLIEDLRASAEYLRSDNARLRANNAQLRRLLLQTAS